MNCDEFKIRCGAKFCVLVFSILSNFIYFSFIACIHCVLVCVFVTMLNADFMTDKRNTPFQSHHDVEFGLQICERCTGTIPMVVTGIYWYCAVFGK